VWPANTPSADLHLRLDTTIEADLDVRPARCDQLDVL